MGYDAINASETVRNPFLACVLAIEHAPGMTVGTSVAIAFPRSPMVTAVEAWDLQRFSQGRFILGLGTQVKGHSERRYSVKWEKPSAQLREYVLSLRAIWTSFQTGERLNYAGQHYSFTLMTPEFNPGPIEWPAVPIHVAAVNAGNARVAGELCDGIKLHAFTTPSYVREVILPNIERGLAQSGRTREQFEVCIGGYIASGRNWGEVEQAAEKLRRQIALYASTRTYKPVLDHHGWGDISEPLHQLSVEGRWNELSRLISDEMLEQFVTLAPYDELTDKLRARYGGICDRIGLPVLPGSAEEREVLRATIKELQSP
jgi:probable F420-dependent oxidoreductase